MKILRKLAAVVTAFILTFSMLPSSAMAEDGTPAAEISTGSVESTILDSDNEYSLVEQLADDDIEPFYPANAGASGLHRLEAESMSCASFIENEERRSYIERMMAYYFDNYAELNTALSEGQPVVFMFEGGSDNEDNELYSRNTKYRLAAVCIVVRKNASTGAPYIAYYCEDCTTMPDYPLNYSYSNGHTDFGMATLVDGIYSIYTVNHKSQYAGFNVRTLDGSGYVPSVYMSADGGFALFNGVGINMHTRTKNTVTGSVNTPFSAGCLLIGGGTPFDTYNSFVEAAKPSSTSVTKTTYSGNSIDYYSSGTGAKAGVLVMDRALYADKMESIYGNAEAVDYITAFSQKAQAFDAGSLYPCEYYPSHGVVKLSGAAALKSLPSNYSAAESGELCAGSLLNVTALYRNGADELWYCVYYGGKYLYIRADNVSSYVPDYSDIKLYDYSKPEKVTFGSSFSLTGNLSSPYNRCTKVAGAVICADGSVAQSMEVDGAYNTFTVSSSKINAKIAFGKLAVGKYTYRLYADVRNYYASGEDVSYYEKEITFIDKEFEVACTVTFNANGGTVSPASMTTSGTLASLPTPKRDGHKFIGWYDAASGGNKITADTVFRGNTTVYAHWDTVEYDIALAAKPAGTGVVSGGGTFEDGEQITVCAEPAAGYLFVCWTDGKNTLSYEPEYTFTVSEDKKLIAHFNSRAAAVRNIRTTTTTTTADETTTAVTTTTETTEAVTTTVETTTAMTTTTTAATTAAEATAPTTTTSTSPVENQDGESNIIKRIAGESRTDTAVQISTAAFSRSSNVVLASGDGYADALAGAPLAYALNAPILLTRSGELDSSGITEIERLGAENVYILGGETVVSSQTADMLAQRGYNVARIAGKNRFETAVKIAEKLADVTGCVSDEVFFACAENYPDALAVGSIAAIKGVPVLYISQKGIPESSVRDYLGWSGATKAYILGGKSAISGQAESNIQAITNKTPERIGGTDRYDTNLCINKRFETLFGNAALCVATGRNYPDALAGGVLAAVKGAPMLLVDGAGKALNGVQREYMDKISPAEIYVLGGENAVSAAIYSEINA